MAKSKQKLELTWIGKDKPVITWLILVYDQTADERFPLKRKWYRFNYDRATDDEVAQVLRLVSKETTGDTLPKPDMKIGEERITFQLSGGDVFTSREILLYRHLFECVPDESRVFSEEEASTGFLSVTLSPKSYFEDENEKPITLTQIYDSEAQRESGENAFAIVYDQPESILRLGPVEPIRPERWSAADAELVTHFFDVYCQLLNYRWLQSRCVVTSSKEGTCRAILPSREDYTGVIFLFRQLYSKDGMDDLFNRCCKIHNRHCPKDYPAFGWVKHYQDAFNAFLQTPPGFPLSDCSLSAQRYLDAFVYGARFAHGSSKKDAPVDDLCGLLKNHQREHVVMGCHYILQTLLKYLSMVVPVIQQDVVHWINDLRWAKGNRTGAQELFG